MYNNDNDDDDDDDDDDDNYSIIKFKEGAQFAMAVFSGAIM